MAKGLRSVRECRPWIGEGRETGWKKVLLAIKSTALVSGAVGLGCSLGTLLMTPFKELVVSSVSVWVSLFLTVANPLYGLMIAIITSPISAHFASIELGTGIPNATPDRTVVVSLLALLLCRAATSQEKSCHANVSVNLATLLFLGGYALSFRNNYWPVNRAGSFLVDAWILPMIICFVISNLVVDRRTLDITLNLLLLLGVYSALYMVYEQATGNVLFEVRSNVQHFYEDTGLRIVRGLYGTTSIFGNLFNLLIPIDLYYLLKARTAGKKTWYFVAFVLMLVGVFFTYKRAVWLGMLLSFLIIQWFCVQSRKFLIPILLVFAVVIAASEMVRARITEIDAWQTAGGRTQRWDEGVETWKQSPIFGGGFRSYEKEGRYTGVENLYIHLLASAGLFTFVPFIAMFLIILKKSIRVFRQAGDNQRLFVDRDLVTVFWGAFAAFLFMAYFGSGVETQPISNYVLFTITGAIVGSQMPLLVESARAAVTR